MVISLDQASYSLGYAVLDDDSIIEYGCFVQPKRDVKTKGIVKEATKIRINKVKHFFETLITKYSPEHVVLEEVTDHKNKQTFKTLAQLQGVLIDLCVEYSLAYTILQPSTWRSTLFHCTPKREEAKEMAFKFIEEQNIDCTQEDTAEALCIGFAYNIIKRIEL